MVHIALLSAFAISTLRIKGSVKRNYALLFAFTLLFLFAAFRYDYGNDFVAYQTIFNEAQLGVNLHAVEPLYFLINKAFPSFQLLIATLSLIYLYVVYKLIVKYLDKKYAAWAVFIFLVNPYLFLMSMSSIRQTLVISLFVASLVLEPKGKLSRAIIFILTIIVSCFIHQTAILLVPFFFIFHMERNTKVDTIIFGAVPMVLLSTSQLLNYLIDKVLMLFSNNLNYAYHLETGGANSLQATLLTLIIYLYVLLSLKNVDEKMYPVVRLYLFGLLFGVLAYRYAMFTRFQMYFDLFGIVALPAVFKANRQIHFPQWKQLLYKYAFPCAIFLIFVLRYYSFFTNEMWSYFFKYTTFFFQ